MDEVFEEVFGGGLGAVGGRPDQAWARKAAGQASSASAVLGGEIRSN